VPPRVSILLPARNAAATLPACLRSVWRQTFTDFECVLVDDGSTDGSGALARAAAAADPRFRVVEGAGHGLVAALRLGHAHCRGSLIGRMDGDDLMHRRRLELQVAALEADASLHGVGCHVHLFPGHAVGPGMAAYAAWLAAIRTPDDVRREAFVECPIAHPTLLLRAKVLAAIPYRDVPWAEDYDLVLRLLAAGHRLAVVPRRLLAWRRGDDQLSATDPRYRIANFVALKAAFLADGFLNGHRRYGLWGYGGTGRALAAALANHGKQPGYIVELHPGRIGNRIRHAEVIRPEALCRQPRLPLLISVARAANRALIRAQLAAFGLQELHDYVCAA